MLDFEQQANQAQALASLDEDWHLLEDAKMRLEEDLVIRRSRPTMISAKYRAREERRRLLKISAGKLRRIEDPEASLCRSVLINNAVRRLQRENRDEKTRNYGIPIVNYFDDSSKENNSSENLLIDSMDTDNSAKKRLSDELCESQSLKRQRHDDDLDLQDDVFSDFYILPPTPRLLSHIDDIPEPQSDHSLNTYHHDNRLDNHNSTNPSCSSSCSSSSSSSSSSSIITAVAAITTTTTTTTTTAALSPSSSNQNNILNEDDIEKQLTTIASRSIATDQMTLMDVTDNDRICDFSRFADSTKSLEERLVELQSLDEHFDLTKFERNNNNQSCGRAFHDIQTFHSLVPGLET